MTCFRLPFLFLLIVSGMAPLIQGAEETQPEIQAVTFSAMGCGPYNEDAENALHQFIALENKTAKSAFLIHCGDIVTGRNFNWKESQYERVASLLKTDNSLPTFVIPGDNEWNDQIDPDRHWGYWEKHFLHFDQSWTVRGATPVIRQAKRTENFAFLLNEVLFIGINKVGGRVHDGEEWVARLSENAEWIDEMLSTHKDDSHTTVIFAQASPGGSFPSFRKAMMQSVKTYEKPVIYIHADNHKWQFVQDDWVKNFTKVTLDVLNRDFPPVQFTVTGDPDKPITFDRRLDSPEWKPNH